MQSTFTPKQTPPWIKKLIIAIICISLGAALWEVYLPGTYTLLSILSLSLRGLYHFFFWQFITYMFVAPIPYGGITISYLIHLGFSMYLLWVFGTSIIQLKGKKHFFKLFIGGGLLAGLMAGLVLYLSRSPYLFSGPTPGIYTLLLAWMMLFPEATIHLFLVFPMKTKWLILILVGLNLILDLSSGNLLHFLPFVTAIVFGYIYPIFAWNCRGPFSFLDPFETFLKRFSKSSSSKIFEIKTGKATSSDDAFMNMCLEKIAKKGKSSLTWSERRRMEKISKRRKH